MAGTFNFVVVAPAGEVLNTEVEFILAPGAEGELGILANHSPLIANLVIGVVRYTQNGKSGKNGNWRRIFGSCPEQGNDPGRHRRACGIYRRRESRGGQRAR